MNNPQPINPEKPELEANVQKLRESAFQNGEKGCQEDASIIRKISHEKLSLMESERLNRAIMFLYMASPEAPPTRIKTSIMVRTQGRLTAAEVDEIYQFITGDMGVPLYSGGDGSSEDNAVIINCSRTFAGVQAEHLFLRKQYDRRNIDWKNVAVILKDHRERMLVWFILPFTDGTKRDIYFDATAYFGR